MHALRRFRRKAANSNLAEEKSTPSDPRSGTCIKTSLKVDFGEIMPTLPFVTHDQVALGQMVNVVYFTAMCAFIFGLIGTAEFGGSYRRQCVLPVGENSLSSKRPTCLPSQVLFSRCMECNCSSKSKRNVVKSNAQLIWHWQ